MQWFEDLLAAGRDLAPHGYCLMWRPELVWLHVVSDALIAAAYFSIPVALARFVRRRDDIEFGWMIWLFVLFIAACGTTHLLGIWTLWHADYALEGVVKAITAAASIATAIMLWPLIPKLLAVASPAQLAKERDYLAQTLDKLRVATVERDKAEAALRQAQKLEAVGQLTGGIAHDFNNLLQTITGSLDMIARQPDGDKVGRWAGLGLQAAEKGTKITAQLLAFSKTQRLQLEPSAVTPLLGGMRELVDSAAGAKVEVRWAIDGLDDVLVLADPTQIELAVLNLAINGRDAMPDGGVLTIAADRRVVAAHDQLEPGDYLAIAVTDTGSGMSEEVRERAFEPFFTTKKDQGSGLGLAMVYAVARQSGGTAEIVTAEGKGTTITILLRIIEGVEAGGAPATLRDASVQRPLKILLVDDEDDVRTITAGMLSSLGHDVTEAASGPAALEQASGLAPDLLILDFAMPEMTGAELAAKLAEQGIEAPVLFATGFSDTASIEAATPGARLLRKPFSTDELAEAVAAAVRGAG